MADWTKRPMVDPGLFNAERVLVFLYDTEQVGDRIYLGKATTSADGANPLNINWPFSKLKSKTDPLEIALQVGIRNFAQDFRPKSGPAEIQKLTTYRPPETETDPWKRTAENIIRLPHHYGTERTWTHDVILAALINMAGGGERISLTPADLEAARRLLEGKTIIQKMVEDPLSVMIEIGD